MYHASSPAVSNINKFLIEINNPSVGKHYNILCSQTISHSRPTIERSAIYYTQQMNRHCQ